MENKNKELPKALTIEELKNRVGKPVFVVGLIYGAKNWRVVKGFGGVNTIEFTDKSWIAKEYQNKFRFFDMEVTALELKEILESEEKSFDIKEISLTDEEFELISNTINKQFDLCNAFSKTQPIDKYYYNILKSANEKINKYLKGE